MKTPTKEIQIPKLTLFPESKTVFSLFLISFFGFSDFRTPHYSLLDASGQKIQPPRFLTAFSEVIP